MSGLKKQQQQQHNIHSRKSAEQGQPFHWYFSTKDRYSATSSGEPTTNGTLWCRASGWTSRILWVPVVATPPACSMRKAMGLHSYSSRSYQWSEERFCVAAKGTFHFISFRLRRAVV